MKDERKTKKQLIEELKEARRSLAVRQEPAPDIAVMKAFVNVSFSAAYLIDTSGRIVAANEVAARELGKSVDELIGLRMSDLLPPDAIERRRKYAQQTMFTGSSVRFEDEMDGRIFEIDIQPVRDQKDALTYLAVYGRDVTDRKDVEQKLRESERRFRELASNLPSIVFVNQRGAIVYVNRRSEEILGYTKDELCAPDFDCMTLIAQESQDDVMSVFKAHMNDAEAQPRECTLVTKGGRRLETLIATKLISYGQGRAILGVITDITERKKIEDRLKAVNEELEVKAVELGDSNTALKVLLKQREDDRRNLEERIVASIKNLVEPSLSRLKHSHLDHRQRGYLAILESHIDGIVSPFAESLSSPVHGLTFKEIEVAGLIKEGKTTKEIAELLNTSPSTVKFHRENLRRKFKLRNTKSNLRIHLLSLTS